MQLTKILSVFAVLSFSQYIISCGQNVQTPEYSRNSGAYSNPLSEETGSRKGTANQGSATRPGVSSGAASSQTTSISSSKTSGNSGRSNEASVSVAGTPAQPSVAPQGTTSNSSNLGTIFNTVGNTLQVLANNNNKPKPPKAPDYSSAFNSTSPVFTNSSSFYSGSSSSLPDYSSVFSSPSSTFTNPSFGTSTMDFGIEPLF